MKTVLLPVLCVAILALGCAAPKPPVTQVRPTMSPEEADTLLRSGVALHDKGDYAGAIAAYRKVLAADPTNVAAWYELAYSQSAAGKLKDAIESTNRGLQVADAQHQVGLLTLKANCLDDMGQPEKAIDCYREAVKLDPDDYLVHYNLGFTLLRTQRIKQAEAEFKTSAVLNPRHPTSQLMLGQIWGATGRRIQAIFAYTRFLMLEPTGARSRLVRNQLVALMDQGVEKTEKGANISLDVSLFSDDQNPYGTMAFVLATSSALAANNNEVAGNTELQHRCYQFDMLFGVLGENENPKPDFAWKYYAPFFRDLREKELVKPMCMLALQGFDPKEAEAWRKDHPDRMTAFQEWHATAAFPGKEILR